MEPFEAKDLLFVIISKIKDYICYCYKIENLWKKTIL